PLPSHILWLLFSIRGTAEGRLSQASGRDATVKSMTVQEGLCVHVPCEFYYPWLSFMSPYMSWFQKGADVNQDPPVATNKPNQKLHERTQGRFFIRGDLQTGNCSLDITEVHKGDSGTYFFQLGTYSYLDTMPLSILSVLTALSHTPHIIISGTLESGYPRNLTCYVPWACEQGTSPIFSWTSAALTSLGTRTHFSSVLTLTPRPQDHGTNLTCQVYFPAVGVMVGRTVQLNVTYAPQNTAIRIFQGSRTALGTLQNTSSVLISEGQALRLLCVTDSNPPAELSWFQGSPTWKATPICRSPILDLSQVGAVEEGDLICQAQNPLGSQHISLHLSVVCECGDPWEQAAQALGSSGSGWPILIIKHLKINEWVSDKSPIRANSLLVLGCFPSDPTNQLCVSLASTQAYQHQSWTDIPAAPPAPAEARPISEEEQELHYALLRFPKPKYQEQEDIHTEYSEIKTHK
uniref:Ig-like domain-containing protein n=1 Tax=Neovison vison TaxID=452646 RepID=A0A8C7BUW1_NEOVI